MEAGHSSCVGEALLYKALLSKALLGNAFLHLLLWRRGALVGRDL